MSGFESTEKNEQKQVQAGAEKAFADEVLNPNMVNDTKNVAGAAKSGQAEFTAEDLSKMSDAQLAQAAAELEKRLNNAFVQFTPTLQHALKNGTLVNMAKDAPECYAAVKEMSNAYGFPQFKAALNDIDAQTPPMIRQTLGRLGESAS